jgi:beta-1,4-N-acetylglucosaminyltransferase
MIFLTVGTQFSFDRLVKAVDQALDAIGLDEEIYAQVGDSSYRPRNFETASHLEKQRFDDCMRKASSIISHAGMGTITMALDNGKSLLVMPRQKKYGEVVNDHQMAIAKKYEQLGHILVAYNEVELPDRLKQLKDFVPMERQAQCEAVIERIARYLQKIQG